MIRKNTRSANATNMPSTNTVTITTMVESTNSFRVGQDDFFNSVQTSIRKSCALRNGFVMYRYLYPIRQSTCTPTVLRPLTLLLFKLARQEGLEPPTYGFGDRRSAN